MQWGLIVEEVTGFGEQRTWSADVLGHCSGTREEAMARLETLARNHRAEHPMSPQRTLLYRTGDGFLLVSRGAARGYSSRFSVTELLYDSDEAKRVRAEAERREREARKAEKRAQRKSRWGFGGS